MAAAGDAKALGAATCWALQQFEQHFAEASEDDVQASAWKLMPSVGTWLMLTPRSLAEAAAVTSVACDVPVAVKGEPSSSTAHATPRKARASGVTAAKSKSSPKPEARRSPCRSPDGANRSPGLAKPVNSVQARAKSPSAKPVVTSEPPSETLTPSRKRESVGTKPRVNSPRPQPKTEKVPSSAAVDAAASIDAPATELSQHVDQSTLQLEEKEAAQPQAGPTPKTKCNPAVKPRSPSVPKDKPKSPLVPKARPRSPSVPKDRPQSSSVPKDKPQSPSVPKDRPQAKSPTVAVSKAPKSAPQEPRAAQKTPGSTKGLSSAEIEVLEIQERRKQAKLLAEKNARRMIRAPSSKTIAPAAGGQGSPAAPAASSSDISKDDKSATSVASKPGASAGAQTARRPSPVRKTQAMPDKSKDVVKAAVAATPRPVKSATSPRLRQPSAPAEASKGAAAAKSSITASASRTKLQVAAPSQSKPLQRPPSPTSAQRAAKAAASPTLRKATTTVRNGSVKVAAEMPKAAAADIPKESSAAESPSKEISSAIPA
eukprot:TRINITY_DN44999_c0_g1_i1.p1 TRINITY_DN44999_c0_g1~~TRINITY_DN44999_c0_g1_i1.p1  ORF type:complete len:543 (+),score=127.59 TRINITY_DN44999_c0_g1_i1:48-1676(+)